jgi:AcrR family transcriptional regulator
MSACKKGQKTKERILEVAADLFATQGFHKTTVEEISKKAKCNIAAINYHFGGKANLYTETWRYIHASCHHFYEANQPDSNLPAEERLRAYILFLLKLLSNEDELEKLHMLHQREFLSPSGLVDDLWQEIREPLQHKFRDAIKEIMGEEAEEKDVMFCEKMVVDMCRGVLLPNRRHDQHFFEGLELTDEELERMADRYIRFCLPGIRSFCAG